MKIALFPNLTRENAVQVTAGVCRVLTEMGAGFCFDAQTGRRLNAPDEQRMEEAELLRTCDVVITIGGDGSLIHAAKKAIVYRKPVLGINAGKLAFMAGVERDELELLRGLSDGNYAVDRRMLLDVVLERGGGRKKLGTCLNDAVIARGGQIKLVRLHIFCDGREINNYYADGVIVSTPTGSTAYSLSAGGPVVDPKIESILLTPICAHTLSSRTIVFAQNSVLRIEIPQDSTDNVYLSCDGDASLELQAGDRIIVRKSESHADFIRLKNDTFIDVLDRKLSQRRA